MARSVDREALGERFKETIESLRANADDLAWQAHELETAWQKWDYEALEELGVISQREHYALEDEDAGNQPHEDTEDEDEEDDDLPDEYKDRG